MQPTYFQFPFVGTVCRLLGRLLLPLKGGSVQLHKFCCRDRKCAESFCAQANHRSSRFGKVFWDKRREIRGDPVRRPLDGHTKTGTTLSPHSKGPRIARAGCYASSLPPATSPAVLVFSRTIALFNASVRVFGCCWS